MRCKKKKKEGRKEGQLNRRRRDAAKESQRGLNFNVWHRKVKLVH